MTFSQDRIPVPGIPGNVVGQDIVQFDGYFHDDHWDEYEYSLMFDGSDVGLTTRGEKIDGISVWPPEYYDALAGDIELPYDCNAGVVFITTQGAYRVPNNQGGFLIGEGSDVLLFCATNLGSDTAGFWFRAFDGSDAGIFPPNAGFSIDTWAIEFFESGEDAGDLDLGILFFFVPKKDFESFCDDGSPSELHVGGVFGIPCTEGPFVDFNLGEIYDGLHDTITFPGVNGVVDSAGVWDWPFTEGP
jgi:hypothetical protein